MFKFLQRLNDLLRRYHVALATTCLTCICPIGILHYYFCNYDCDLLCWLQHWDQIDNKSFAIMLLIVVFKLLLILILTLLSYTKFQPELQPLVADIKRRYRRFIVMRLIAAHQKFLQQDKVQIEQRHSELLQAIQLFRSDARKLFERSADHLSRPNHQLLAIQKHQEQKLLQLGYDRNQCVSQLRDVDIYRLVLALPLSKAEK